MQIKGVNFKINRHLVYLGPTMLAVLDICGVSANRPNFGTYILAQMNAKKNLAQSDASYKTVYCPHSDRLT